MEYHIFVLLGMVATLYISPVRGLSYAPDVIPELIVDFINGVRSTVVPPASDMNKIEWDGMLADDAQKRADSCLFARGQNLSQPSHCISGECVEIVSYYDAGSASNFIQDTLFKWLYKREKYIFGINPCFLSRHSCGLYTQLVWAESNRIGCGLKRCRRPNMLNLVCLFDPPGNVPQRYHPYIHGKPCSNCPPEKPFCDNNFCSDGILTGSDPHFSVRLPSGQLFCFTVQGEVGMSFNLISTDELEMNARFIQLPDHPNNTWLGALSITVAGRKLIFNSTTCTVSIDDKVTFDPSAVQKITVNKHQLVLEMTKEETKGNNKVEVDIRQFNLQFTVVFVMRHLESQHLDMLWNSGGIDAEDARGLLSQLLCSGSIIDEEKRLLLRPGRPAVPLKQHQVIVHSDAYRTEVKSCWIADKHRNQDIPVIKGPVVEYELSSLLSTGFSFGVANTTRV